MFYVSYIFVFIFFCKKMAMYTKKNKDLWNIISNRPCWLWQLASKVFFLRRTNVHYEVAKSDFNARAAQQWFADLLMTCFWGSKTSHQTWSTTNSNSEIHGNIQNNCITTTDVDKSLFTTINKCYMNPFTLQFHTGPKTQI